jgi:hypothetical protein
VEWLIVDEPATNLPSFLLNIHLYTNELRNRLFRVNGIKAFLTNSLHDNTSVVLCQLFLSSVRRQRLRHNLIMDTLARLINPVKLPQFPIVLVSCL